MVVGLGQIGMGYDLHLDPEIKILTHTRAFDQHPSFDLVCAVDPDCQRREEFKVHYGKPVFLSLAEVSVPQLDLVAISAPTSLRYELVSQVIRVVKPKAILCEKPIAYDLTEARLIVELCESHGVELFINYMRRADSAVAEISELFSKGAIAGPIKGTVWYSKGLIHNGSHFFDLLEIWLGRMRHYKILSAEPFGSDSNMDVKITFEKGEVVFLALEDRCFAHYELELIAQNGILRYEKAGHRVNWHPVVEDPDFKGSSFISVTGKSIKSGMSKFQFNVVEQLDMALKGAAHNLATGKDGLRSVDILTEIVNG